MIRNVEMRHSRNDILDENKHIDCKITSKNTLCVLHIQLFWYGMSRCDIPAPGTKEARTRLEWGRPNRS